MTAHVAALNVHPVKSCRGIATAVADVTERGLAVRGSGDAAATILGDREWMVIDADGRFVTQREQPRLALVETGVGDATLLLGAEGVPQAEVPIESVDASPRAATVWNHQTRALDAGDVAADWLSALLGMEARLVRFDPAARRPCNPDYAGDSGAHVAFSDGYPVLVIGEASLADLNARLAAKGSAALPMNRFRPNVVVAGLDPYEEDHLDTVIIGAVTLKLVKPCTRCQITTTDQERARVGHEPLPTLASFRHDARLGGVTFGMNAIVISGAGSRISVGDAAACSLRF